MPIYQYEAMNNSGLEIADRIEAPSEQQAQQLLRERGLFITTINEDSSSPIKTNHHAYNEASSVRMELSDRFKDFVNATRKIIVAILYYFIYPLLQIEWITQMAIRKISKMHTPTIRIEVIGYSSSGKTSLYTAVKSLLDSRTRSGIFLQTVGDPDEFIRQRTIMNQRIDTARSEGMETTVGTEARECFRFCAKYKSEKMLHGELRECMGQALENPSDHAEEYGEFVARIPEADVLWIVLPLSQIDDEIEFKRVCQTCHKYLEHALEIRRDSGVTKAPVIAIVGTKMDTLGNTASQVEARLSELGLDSFFEIPETIREFLTPESAVFPTSFFGYGKAVEVPGRLDEYKMVDENSEPAPENISALVYWTLAAHLNSVGDRTKRRGGPTLADVAKNLQADLKDAEPIALGITGRLVEVEA